MEATEALLTVIGAVVLIGGSVAAVIGLISKFRDD